MEETQDKEAIDSAQTAFALGQYQNAIEIATDVLNENQHREIIPTRLWRIVLASTCALKQGDRARAYALNLGAQTVIGDQLVVYFCAKNHITFPPTIVDPKSIAE